MKYFSIWRRKKKWVVYFHCELSLEGKECEEVTCKFGRDGTVKERWNMSWVACLRWRTKLSSEQDTDTGSSLAMRWFNPLCFKKTWYLLWCTKWISLFLKCCISHIALLLHQGSRHNGLVPGHMLGNLSHHNELIQNNLCASHQFAAWLQVQKGKTDLGTVLLDCHPRGTLKCQIFPWSLWFLASQAIPLYPSHSSAKWTCASSGLIWGWRPSPSSLSKCPKFHPHPFTHLSCVPCWDVTASPWETPGSG